MRKREKKERRKNVTYETRARGEKKDLNKGREGEGRKHKRWNLGNCDKAV